MSLKCVLEGQKLSSLDDVYDAMARQLDFPDHFGRNLDALWDVLTTDLPGPVRITWKSSKSSKSVMGSDYLKIADLLKEVAREREDVKVYFK